MRRGTLWVLIIAVTAATYANADTIQERYVTSWTTNAKARMTYSENREVNAVRYRVLDPSNEVERRLATWFPCRVVSQGRLMPHRGRSWDDPRPSWHADFGDLKPGDYSAEFDMRTPQEGLFVKTTLRVPQIARYMSGDEWPQSEYPLTSQDGDLVWIGWSQDALHIRPLEGAPSDLKLSVDVLPNTPGRLTFSAPVRAEVAYSWEEAAPAGPYIGQVLRITLKNSKGEVLQDSDLLFVGSGSGMYYGANRVSAPPGHDDQGPPVQLLQALYRMGGLTEEHTGLSLHEFFPDGPPEKTPKPEDLDFTKFIKNPDTYFDGHVICGVSPFEEWMRDREYDPEIWPAIEAYAEGLARAASSVGIHTYSAGYNEPGLFYRSDREFFFVNNLSHFAKAIRRGDPQAKIIAGKFSGGDPGLIRAFMAAGMGDWMDILDVHTYSNDPRIGLDMGGVVASHETLEELGQGDKQIYLGEGWGPTRDLHQWVRTKHDEPVAPEEADFMRQFFWNGYRVLVTPRDDYNPEWMHGARFFTLNDNLGMTYWSVNAVPHYNEVGEIDYYLLSHLRFGDLSDMKPGFFNGGLVDFYARPKGDWFFDFPPALPDVRVEATPDFDYLLPGDAREVEIRITNAAALPLTDLTIGIRSRTYKWDRGNGHLSAEPLGDVTRDVLESGEIWTIKARVSATSDFPRPVRIAVELDYHHEGTLYCADDVIRTTLREPLAVSFEPQRAILEHPDSSEKVEVTIANNGDAVADVSVPASVAGVELDPSESSVSVEPGHVRTVDLKVSAPDLGPGIDDIRIGGDVFEALTVIRPMECLYASRAPVIDGDLSDWPKMERINSVRFGRSAAKTERPTWVAFPVPPPPKKSAFEESGINAIGPDRRDDDVASFAADGVIMWDKRYLYLGFWVEDSTHSQNEFGGQMWRGDSIQVGIDPLGNGAGERTVTPGQFLKRTAEENYMPDDFEICLGLTRTGPQMFIIHGPTDHPKGLVKDGQLTIIHKDDSTVYEAAIPWATLNLDSPTLGQEMRMDVLVNNFDGKDRYVLGLGDGIGAGKYPSRFLPVRFVR